MVIEAIPLYLLAVGLVLLWIIDLRQEIKDFKKRRHEREELFKKLHGLIDHLDKSLETSSQETID